MSLKLSSPPEGSFQLFGLDSDSLMFSPRRIPAKSEPSQVYKDNFLLRASVDERGTGEMTPQRNR